jgi:DNA-binding CsgD family transcriptional regulator
MDTAIGSQTLGNIDLAMARLSPRQREILQRIAEGQSTREIGYRLILSGKTIETHRRLLMRRLDIHDVAGLVRFAVRAGLVPLKRQEAPQE